MSSLRNGKIIPESSRKSEDELKKAITEFNKSLIVECNMTRDGGTGPFNGLVKNRGVTKLITIRKLKKSKKIDNKIDIFEVISSNYEDINRDGNKILPNKKYERFTFELGEYPDIVKYLKKIKFIHYNNSTNLFFIIY